MPMENSQDRAFTEHSSSAPSLKAGVTSSSSPYSWISMCTNLTVSNGNEGITYGVIPPMLSTSTIVWSHATFWQVSHVPGLLSLLSDIPRYYLRDHVDFRYVTDTFSPVASIESCNAVNAARTGSLSLTYDAQFITWPTAWLDASEWRVANLLWSEFLFLCVVLDRV